MTSRLKSIPACPPTIYEPTPPSFQCGQINTGPDPIPGRQAPPPPPPELVNSEEEYVVEKVLNSRMFQCKLQYLVKWEGYYPVSLSSSL